MSLAEVKNFIITGEIKKRFMKIHFEKEIVDISKENALEKIFSELGSRHKAKRFEIKIINIKEKK
jgi:ribosomal protein L20A (L18A)